MSSEGETPMYDEQEEYLTRCVVDPTSRKFYLYSSEGSTKEINCETVTQFMNVLGVVRSKLHEDTLVYTQPL